MRLGKMTRRLNSFIRYYTISMRSLRGRSTIVWMARIGSFNTWPITKRRQKIVGCPWWQNIGVVPNSAKQRRWTHWRRLQFSKFIEKESRSTSHWLASETLERKMVSSMILCMTATVFFLLSAYICHVCVILLSEIVKALNRCTGKLQKSLAVVSVGVD